MKEEGEIEEGEQKEIEKMQISKDIAQKLAVVPSIIIKINAFGLKFVTCKQYFRIRHLLSVKWKVLGKISVWMQSVVYILLKPCKQQSVPLKLCIHFRPLHTYTHNA